MTSVEKEATAIVEAVRKWSHLILGCHFKRVSDQRSVSFMFNVSNRGKINNAKVMRWRLELIQIAMKLRQVNFAVQIRGEDHKELDQVERQADCRDVAEEIGERKRNGELIVYTGNAQSWIRIKCVWTRGVKWKA